MNIDHIEQLHNQAMIFADDADLLKHHGRKEDSIIFYEKAYKAERDAVFESIKCCIDDFSVNILIKSAAFLAYEAGLIRDSEQMVGLALSRNLPEEIAEEMRDLLENLNFSRHLRLNGITLSDNEVQIVVAGSGVAHGMAREDDINDRITTFKQIVIRSAERSRGKVFRIKGKPQKEITDICTSYLSIPRAASFAVTMRIGEPIQKTFDSIQGETNALIEDIVTNLSLVNNQDISTLRGRIKDQSYLENFVNLAKEFAPDGERINLVGLTFNRNGNEMPIKLTTPKAKYRDVALSLATDKNAEDIGQDIIPAKETMTGMLYAANAQSDIVKLKVKNRGNINIKVPEGLTEIVRKYFDTEVTALVTQDKQKGMYRLISVDPEEAEPQIFL